MSQDYLLSLVTPSWDSPGPDGPRKVFRRTCTASQMGAYCPLEPAPPTLKALRRGGRADCPLAGTGPPAWLVHHPHTSSSCLPGSQTREPVHSRVLITICIPPLSSRCAGRYNSGRENRKKFRNLFSKDIQIS